MENPLEIILPHEFLPWRHQEDIFVAFYEQGIRRFCEVIHRRGGKDKAALNLMICEMMQRVGNYCHVFPQRQRARLIVWEGIDTEGRRYIDHFPSGLVHRKLEQEMMISLQHPADATREGSIYRCMGSDRDTYLLVGSNPVGVIWSEFPEIDPRMRELVLPILRRNGGWEMLVYTPRGRNHGYRVYQQVKTDPAWHTSYLTIDHTVDHAGEPLVSRVDVEADIRAGMHRETAEQEYYLSWDIPMPGAVYSAEMQAVDRDGRIGDYPYDPTLPVLTSWDIGPAHTAVWFFQQRMDNIYYIDYEEGPGSIEAWIELCRGKGYNYDHSRATPALTQHAYERHYAPWDIGKESYRKHAAGGAMRLEKTRYGIALDMGWRFTVVPQGAVEERIEATRRLLASAYFDERRTVNGLDALRSYRYEWDERKLTFQRIPVHDWASHGADSFGCGAVGMAPALVGAGEKEQPGSFEWARKQAIRYQQGRSSRPQSFKVYS